MMQQLNLAEVFDSIQGEGPYIGTKQAFVRLAGCNLTCSYCDTAWAWSTPDTCEVSLGDFKEVYTNPMPAKTAAEIIAKYLPENTFAVSVTGGEPLVQAEALLDFLPVLHGKTKILLETNGTLPDKLKLLLPWVDIISMDIKLPQYIGKDLLETHREFLINAGNVEKYIKLVVSETTQQKDILAAAEMVAAIDTSITFVIQPLAENKSQYKINIEELYKLQTHLLTFLRDVRIIPQIHKLIGIK